MAKAPKNKLLAVVLPFEDHARLEKMAQASGQPVEDLAERFLRDIAACFVRQVEGAKP